MTYNLPKEKQTALMELADNMAAAATTFNSHGYDSFINAREQFIKSVAEMDLDRRKVDRNEKLVVNSPGIENYNFNLKADFD